MRTASRCASPYTASLQSSSVYPTQHSEACLERTESLFEPIPQYICALADTYFQFPETLLHPLILCVLSLLGNTLCSSCLSRSQSFLSSSPIPRWETLHSTWPSFQSGATFTDVSSLCLIVPYLEWEKACPIIVTTKANQAHVHRLLWPPWGVWKEA